MIERTVSDWIRTHLYYVSGTNEQFLLEKPSMADVEAHVEERLGRAFHLLRTKCAIGLILYESNRGRSPCYLQCLEQSLVKYKQTGNLDALLDVAFYAIVESDNPSFEGTFFDSGDEQSQQLKIER